MIPNQAARREVAVIDNRRKTLHNLHTSMHETIAKVHLDFIASMGAQLLRALGHFSGDSQSMNHAWLRLRVGTDDLPNPYRGLPVLPARRPFSVVAIYTPEGGRFTELYGLAPGIGGISF